MITSEERKKLREILGNSYTKEVVKGLIDNGLKVYPRNYIRRVFNEGINNPNIEMVIWKVASVKKQQQNELNKAKNQILKS